MADDGNGIKTDVDMQGAWEAAKSASAPLQMSKEGMDYQRALAMEAKSPSQLFPSMPATPENAAKLGMLKA